MRATIATSYGAVQVHLFQHTDVPDEWWATIDNPPEQLRNGGPTVATAATAELALTVLEVAIERFAQAGVSLERRDREPARPVLVAVERRRRSGT